MNENAPEVVAGGPPTEPVTPETLPTETTLPVVPVETRKQTAEEVFVNAWIDVQHDLTLGKLTGDGKDIVAKRLNLAKNSVDQRKNKINKRLRDAKLAELPKMPRAPGNRADASRTAALIAAAQAKFAPPVEQPAPETQSV